jgi:hypothetical protein
MRACRNLHRQGSTACEALRAGCVCVCVLGVCVLFFQQRPAASRASPQAHQAFPPPPSQARPSRARVAGSAFCSRGHRLCGICPRTHTPARDHRPRRDTRVPCAGRRSLLLPPTSFLRAGTSRPRTSPPPPQTPSPLHGLPAAPRGRRQARNHPEELRAALSELPSHSTAGGVTEDHTSLTPTLPHFPLQRQAGSKLLSSPH